MQTTATNSTSTPNPDTTRRQFLQQTTAIAAGAVAVSSVPHLARGAAAPGANDKIVLGIIGPGGQGRSLLRSFVTIPGVAVTHACDVDDRQIADGVATIREAGGAMPKTTKDMRQVFDDPTVDAVIIATPDHWHAPATLLAVAAGKHVYVEKPCSHNVREGRLMVEAARANKKVVQVGTQSRSVDHNRKAMQMLREGVIGEVLVSKAWNSQRRGTIGKSQPQDPPANLDYDAWIGPAPMVPYRPNLLPAVWRWWYDFGSGDIGNDGVHDIDIARWGLGVETHPSKVAGQGGKLFFDDDMQFPDTYYVSFEYEPSASTNNKRKMLVYEQRIWSPHTQEGAENGCAFYGTEGMMVGGKKVGWQIIRPGNELGEKVHSEWSDANHHRDFLECIKSGGETRPRADIEIGHLSSCLSHLGNIALRTGRSYRFDPKAEKIVGDEEANALVTRKYRDGHWAVPKNA
jgi:predicted dehydrogenase